MSMKIVRMSDNCIKPSQKCHGFGGLDRETTLAGPSLANCSLQPPRETSGHSATRETKSPACSVG